MMSVCSTSNWVAICSTAEVKRMTASRASSFLRLKPMAPIAATLIEAPATAAKTSIMAQWAASAVYPSKLVDRGQVVAGVDQLVAGDDGATAAASLVINLRQQVAGVGQTHVVIGFAARV